MTANINNLSKNNLDFSVEKLNDVKNKDNALYKKRLKEASQGMEAEFLKIMLKSMKNTVKRADEKNKSTGSELMNEFMLERFAEHMASTSPLGVSDLIIRDVEKTNNTKVDK